MNDIQTFIFAHDNVPFLVAGCVVLGIMVLELLATLFGMSSMAHTDAHIDFHADLNGNGIPDFLEGGHADIMGWINPGQVPLMIFLLLFSGAFSLLGFSAQWIVQGLLGSLIPLLISIPVVAALSLPVVRLGSKGIVQIMPQDVSNAVTTESLTGTGGVVNVGPVSRDTSGVARFTDQFGTDHNVIVFADGDENIAIGEKVVLLEPHREKSYAFMVRRI